MKTKEEIINRINDKLKKIILTGDYYFYQHPTYKFLHLDGAFTSKQLRKIANVMDNIKYENKRRNNQTS